jgi:hypothetical protein
MNDRYTSGYDMTIKEASAFLARYNDAQDSGAPLYPCTHGHFDCSDVLRGPCLDEVLSTHPEIAPDF